VVTALLGTVLERDGSVYRVSTEQGEIRAILAGKAKRDTTRVVVGDRVRLEPEPEGPLHAIVGVEPRTALLERRVPEGRGSRPVAANVDQVFVVTATVDPAPIPQLIDRLLVVAEANEIPAAVVVNKVDLDPGEALVARCRKAGYAVYATSTKSGLGIAEFGAALARHRSIRRGQVEPAQPRAAGTSAPHGGDQRQGPAREEHHGVGRDAAARRGRVFGGHTGVQRGRTLGDRPG
jgi:putative ribosome biogenesis GTPase RsgA